MWAPLLLTTFLAFPLAGLASSDVRFEGGRLRGIPSGGSFDLIDSEDCPVVRSPAELRVPARCGFLRGTYEQTEFGLHREREGSYAFLVMEADD